LAPAIFFSPLFPIQFPPMDDRSSPDVRRSENVRSFLASCHRQCSPRRLSFPFPSAAWKPFSLMVIDSHIDPFLLVVTQYLLSHPPIQDCTDQRDSSSLRARSPPVRAGIPLRGAPSLSLSPAKRFPEERSEIIFRWFISSFANEWKKGHVPPFCREDPILIVVFRVGAEVYFFLPSLSFNS